MINSTKGFVVITGASGFLGSHLAQACVTAGYELLGVDIKPPANAHIWTEFEISHCDKFSIEVFFEKYNPSKVFHLAGGSSVSNSIDNPYWDFTSLLPGTANLIASLAKLKSNAKLIFFSSAAVYGNPRSLPIPEDAPISPISPYGIHKATAECLLKYYALTYSIPVSVLRIFSAYGPGLQKQLIWDLAQRALETDAIERNSITLSGTGNETRDFIFASDVARAAICIAENSEKTLFQLYNVASGKEISIKEVANLVIKNLGLNLDIRFNGNQRSGDPLNWMADIKRLNNCSFRPEIDFGHGIALVTEWIRRTRNIYH